MSDHPTLGRILKELRNHRGWTLKEMSERSGIPISTLSKVEHDRLTLTYDKLLQLSQKLRIRISELFAESDSAEEGVTARRSIGRIDDSVRVTTPNYDYYYLCTELRRKRMIPILTQIRAKSLSEFGDLVRHSGEEYIHVLEGSIVVHSEFYDPVDAAHGRRHLYRFQHGPRLYRRRGLRRGAGPRHLLERRRKPDELADEHPRAGRRGEPAVEEVDVAPIRVRRLDRPAA